MTAGIKLTTYKFDKKITIVNYVEIKCLLANIERNCIHEKKTLG